MSESFGEIRETGRGSMAGRIFVTILILLLAWLIHFTASNVQTSIATVQQSIEELPDLESCADMTVAQAIVSCECEGRIGILKVEEGKPQKFSAKDCECVVVAVRRLVDSKEEIETE
ncbi:MAG: hypothetical protein ACXABY_01310 [Candidatus Thorarchaeota archaeon]|jgi:hypothetical protein